MDPSTERASLQRWVIGPPSTTYSILTRLGGGAAYSPASSLPRKLIKKRRTWPAACKMRKAKSRSLLSPQQLVSGAFTTGKK
eukprot:1160094-Pelagomonas_calceolata.AAC.4